MSDYNPELKSPFPNVEWRRYVISLLPQIFQEPCREPNRIVEEIFMRFGCTSGECAKCFGNLGLPYTRETGYPLIIPEGFGLVIGSGLAGLFLITYCQYRYQLARKRYKMPPALIQHSSSTKFNTLARPFWATMENYPQFLYLMIIGGLEMPYFCFFGSLIWLFGRWRYARNCFVNGSNAFTRKVSFVGRIWRRGSFWWIGYFFMWFAAIKFTGVKILSQILYDY